MYSAIQLTFFDAFSFTNCYILLGPVYGSLQTIKNLSVPCFIKLLLVHKLVPVYGGQGETEKRGR